MNERNDSCPAPAWPDIPGYPADLFRGTAQYYSRYRPPYPRDMLDDMRTRAGVTGHGRLLDLACGTGELALPLHEYFSEVLAVDQEPEMVDAGREKAKQGGVANVRWITERAEDLDEEPGAFELITVGNAFHRLDRKLVARHARMWLAPGRCLAVVGSSSVWTGTAEWQKAAVDVIRKWTAAGARPQPPAPKADEQPRQTHEEVLLAAGFTDVVEYEFPTPHDWTLDEFIGYLRSTSVASKAVRAGVIEQLEAKLRQRMLAFDPAGRYEEIIAFYYLLARNPAS